MFKFWLQIFWEALEHSLQTIGKEPSDIAVSIVVFLIIGFLLVRKKGKVKGLDEVKQRIPKALGEDFIIVLCVFILIVGFHMAKDAYGEWKSTDDRARRIEEENKKLSHELEQE